MRLSKQQIEQARKSAARVTREKRGSMSYEVARNTERRFAARRKRDASKALMMGVSDRFIEQEIPAYLNGEAVRHG